MEGEDNNVGTSSGLFRDHLWPLSLLIKFNEQDHLKNGEGLATSSSNTSGEKQDNAVSPTTTVPSLSQRVYTLIVQRTQNKFQPTQTLLEDARILSEPR